MGCNRTTTTTKPRPTMTTGDRIYYSLIKKTAMTLKKNYKPERLEKYLAHCEQAQPERKHVIDKIRRELE